MQSRLLSRFHRRSRSRQLQQAFGLVCSVLILWKRDFIFKKMFSMKTRLSIVRFQNCDPDRVFQIVSQSRSRKRPAVVIALSKDCVFHNLGRFLPGIGTRRSSYRNHQGCSLWDPTGSGSSVFLSEHFNCHMFIVMTEYCVNNWVRILHSFKLLSTDCCSYANLNEGRSSTFTSHMQSGNDLRASYFKAASYFKLFILSYFPF